LPLLPLLCMYANYQLSAISYQLFALQTEN